MTLTLHRWQEECLSLLRQRVIRPTVPGIVQAVTGCHAAGQGILMFDGSIKRVEDVVVGDRLMGPDSTPRTVLSLCRGEDEMFDIVPVKGKAWRVNGDHVLTLVDPVNCRVDDVTVRAWMRWHPEKRDHWRLLRAMTDERPIRRWGHIRFALRPAGTIEPFYGFTLDGDSRYLLDDFTVTHNSGKSICQAKLVQLLVSTLPKDQITFVATSRRVLVEQLFKDVSEHVAKQMLGYYFGDGKRFLGKRAIFTTYASLTDCVRAVTSQGGKVGAVLLDEAHNTGSEATNDWLMEQVSGGLKRVYGFTATDFRGNPKERLQWCTERIYSYPYERAIADGVIVPYVYKGRAGDVTETDDDIIQMILATDATRYGAGLVTAKSIEDAKTFAARLSEAGLLARHVASDLGRRVIPEVEEGFRSGAILAITSPRLVAEGYDYPPLKWMCFRAPLTTQGRVLAIQTVGRVLRRVRPQKFPAEVRRWGAMEEALVLDPRDAFGQIGIRHDPALGPVEEEITSAPERLEKEMVEVGLKDPSPDHLDSVEEPVAWARGVLMWAQQGTAVSPLATCLSPSRIRDKTPTAVSDVQGRYARDYRGVLHSVARINEPHRRLLFQGLHLVERWARSEEGMGRWRHAAAVLQVADTLVAWFCGAMQGQPQLFGRGQPLTIPDHVLPYTSRPARDT